MKVEGTHKGYGYACFDNVEATETVFNALANYTIAGQRVRVIKTPLSLQLPPSMAEIYTDHVKVSKEKKIRKESRTGFRILILIFQYSRINNF